MNAIGSLSANNWGIFLMMYSNCLNFQDQCLGYVENQIKNARVCNHETQVKEETKIETEYTDVPVCSWCGHRCENYEEFNFRDREILQCVECDNDFVVMRSKKEVYTTRKVLKKYM